MAKYKQKCMRCKKNYILATTRQRYILCYDCQKPELYIDIEDPEMKKIFDIPDEFYQDNSFLRDIRIKYNMYNELSEKQIEAFKKVVCELKGEEYVPPTDKETPEEKEKRLFVPPKRDDDEEIEC